MKINRVLTNRSFRLANDTARLANDTAAKKNERLRQIHLTIPINRVNTVLIEQIDGIDLESLERGVGDLLDVLWPTIQAYPTPLPLGITFTDPRVVDRILKHLERETCQAQDPFEPRAPPRTSGNLLS